MRLLNPVFVVLCLAIACFGQEAAPTPTPETQKDSDAKFSAEQKVYFKKMPVALSPLLYAKDTQVEHIKLFLVVHRPKDKEKDLPKIEVCFDFLEKFWEKRNPEDEKIESLLLQIDGSEVQFPLPEKDNAATYRITEDSFLNQSRHFKVILSPEAADSLKKAKYISVRWNRGNFEVSAGSLEVMQKFLDEEMANF